MVRFTRFHKKYVRVFLYLVAFAGTMEPPSVRSKTFGTGCFLCNAFLKNRTDGRNENVFFQRMVFSIVNLLWP